MSELNNSDLEALEVPRHMLGCSVEELTYEHNRSIQVEEFVKHVLYMQKHAGLVQ